MPDDYTYKSCGTNREGNHYCARDYGSSAANSNSYHYSNLDGSYYYSNPNGSTYYNDGNGAATYTPANGRAGSPRVIPAAAAAAAISDREWKT